MKCQQHILHDIVARFLVEMRNRAQLKAQSLMAVLLQP